MRGQTCKLRGEGAIITLILAQASSPLASQHWLWIKLLVFMAGDNAINHISASSIYT